ncbi:MAG: hypothetical protein C4523_06440 [Myxococcales bacterium]|nr:MAG: hypothetical protein C4523_06440 [Myxococcales bacterium]
MKKSLMLVSAILALFFAVACGDDSGGSDFTQEDAGKVYTAVFTEVAKVQTEVFTGLGSAPMGRLMQSDFTFEEDGSFSGSYENPQGGSAAIEGSGSYSEDSFSFEFTITFTDYVSGDITLNGSITYSFEGAASSYTGTYSGSIDVTGAVEGTAEFDLTYSVDGASITIEGTVAGQEVGGSYGY